MLEFIEMLKQNDSTPFLERIAKANRPEKLLMISFLIIILSGSFLLSMPFANLQKPVPYLDNLFVSVSAVCVTGLTTVTVSSQYSVFGKVVLIILMELGGLGPMTIIAVIIQRNRRRMATVEKKLFAFGSGKSDLYDVQKYIQKIMLYTVVFEVIGFIILSIRLTQLYDFGDGLFKALFLSVSAFTNAGFDPIGPDSLLIYAGDPVINFTIMFLIVTGGLGFVVWFELFDLLISRFRRGSVMNRSHRYLSEHATVVLKTTRLLLVLGTVFFAVSEWLNPQTIRNLPAGEKFLISLFQSVTLRTAGFSTVTIGRCTRPMLLIMCLFMMIGGSPGGTAGGIKTTTAAVLSASAWNSLFHRHQDAVIRHRKISSDLLKQAFMIATLYFGIIFVMTLILTVSEHSIDLLSLVFEVFSAIATVGISTGITSLLSVPGKLVIMLLMFIGRLGPLSLFTAFHKKEIKTMGRVTYPDANIIIG